MNAERRMTWDELVAEITRLRAEVERLRFEMVRERQDAYIFKLRAEKAEAELAGIKERIAESVVGVPVRFKDGELCLEVPQNYRHYTKRVHLLLADSDSVSGRV